MPSITGEITPGRVGDGPSGGLETAVTGGVSPVVPAGGGVRDAGEEQPTKPDKADRTRATGRNTRKQVFAGMGECTLAGTDRASSRNSVGPGARAHLLMDGEAGSPAIP
jgi:hypothetical protein